LKAGAPSRPGIEGGGGGGAVAAESTGALVGAGAGGALAAPQALKPTATSTETTAARMRRASRMFTG
jgi:hypothetical protein